MVFDWSNLFDECVFSLNRPNGDIRSSSVIFLSSGLIDGYSHSNEVRWVVDDNNKLLFLNNHSMVTAVSDTVFINENGFYEIKMLRADDLNVAAHYLIGRKVVTDFSLVTDLDELATKISNHPAFCNKSYINNSGFSRPDIKDLKIVCFSADSKAVLDSHGFNVTGVGRGNLFIFDSDFNAGGLRVNLHAGSGNVFVFSRASRIRGFINVVGSDNIFVAGDAYESRDVCLTVEMRYDLCGLYLGKGGSSGGCSVWIEGPNRSVQIGDDYMFSWGVWIGTADSHAIIDLSSDALVNSSKSVVIEGHVWLGQDSLVMPGAHIGAGVIVGAKSIVTKKIPNACVIAGIPAKILRRGASWTRSSNPKIDDIQKLKKLIEAS
jgi:hypothetical protein